MMGIPRSISIPTMMDFQCENNLSRSSEHRWQEGSFASLDDSSRHLPSLPRRYDDDELQGEEDSSARPPKMPRRSKEAPPKFPQRRQSMAVSNNDTRSKNEGLASAA
ncbi:hypothetical protein SEMRO_523_G159770.1 [Seminavis robusta]|uniref:Uncharacterized protein n=1 Tax=Seminavis robusta TaxID=568900 RepID=A0A9N8E431_9STRA|nr:hypothetical protein SEMRO_523_G159770.1 [Seminavis robusta]|eukprot:Sro523_g159770.1 n/a (107) ;mRNA; f:32600-32920